MPLHQAVLRRANTPPHLPVTLLRLSCHIQGGCGMEVFRQRAAHQLFLHLSPRGLSLLEHVDCWAQLYWWEENPHGEPRTRMEAGFKFSLHMCCSSIQMSWWELIPALEEILGVSKVLLIPAVDPNHPLPRDQLGGECYKRLLY